MESIIEIDINKDVHISPFPISHIRKFALYIPPLEQCIPTENHYFGLDELPIGDLLVEQETGKLSMSVRWFIKSIILSDTFAFEMSCSPEFTISQDSNIGRDILAFGRDNLVSNNLIKRYLELYLEAKKKSNGYKKSFRYGTILNRLYKGLRTTEMTDEESSVYKSLTSSPQSEKDLIMANMDFDLQELESKINLDEIYPGIDKNFVNEFLIRIHKTYLGIGGRI